MFEDFTAALLWSSLITLYGTIFISSFTSS